MSPSRVLFVLKDGALAWDVKDYLVQQERCEEVTLEGQDYKGKGASQKVLGLSFFIITMLNNYLIT